MLFPVEFLPGLVSDETTYSTPARYVDGSNVRFWQGKPQTIGGWAKAHATALTGVCRNLISWVDNAGIPLKAFGSTEALQVLFDDTLYDITPSGLGDGNVNATEAGGWGTGGWGTGSWGGGFVEYYPRTWSFGTWGENLMASPRGYPLYIWENDTASAATEVTQSPDEIMQMLVLPGQRVVVALGCNEEVSANFNWLCVRWTHPRDYTNWTTATGSLAGEYILESGGKIVAARMIGDLIAIWTDSGLWIGEYTGDTTQAIRFEPIAANCGCAGPNAVTVINQTAYWLTPDLRFYAWSYGNKPFPVTCQISRDFKDNIDTDQIAKVVATGVSEYNEVWWFYPDSRDGTENSRYVAVNVNTVGNPNVAPQWYRGVMARTAAIDSGPQRYPIFVDYTGYIYNHEYSNTADGGKLSWHYKTSDFYLNDAEQESFVSGMRPDFSGQVGNVLLTIFARRRPQATPRSKGPWNLPAGKEKRDFRITASLLSYKVSGNEVGSFVREGKPAFFVGEGGQRG